LRGSGEPVNLTLTFHAFTLARWSAAIPFIQEHLVGYGTIRTPYLGFTLPLYPPAESIVADRSGSYESPANHQPSATDFTKAREKVRKRYDLDSPSDSGARA